MFHSAKWNHDYDLTGKRIAVIGTGASAIQFVPQIQPKAKELFVFQRTAPWVLPKPDTDLGELSKSIIAKYPKIQASWRQTVAGALNVINFGLRNPKALKPVNFAAKQLLKLQIKDPVLRKTSHLTLILVVNVFYLPITIIQHYKHRIPHLFHMA